MSLPPAPVLQALKKSSASMANRSTPFVYNEWYVAAFSSEVTREFLPRILLEKRVVGKIGFFKLLLFGCGQCSEQITLAGFLEFRFSLQLKFPLQYFTKLSVTYSSKNHSLFSSVKTSVTCQYRRRDRQDSMHAASSRRRRLARRRNALSVV